MDLAANKAAAIDFYRTAYLGEPRRAVEQCLSTPLRVDLARIPAARLRGRYS